MSRGCNVDMFLFPANCFD